MKTKIAVIFIIYGFSFFHLNAQIKLTSDNKIGLGTATPVEKIDINGYTRLYMHKVNNIDVGVRINAYYTEPIIEPFNSNLGILGRERRWNELRVNKIYYTTMQQDPSDEKLKENIVPLIDAIPVIKQIQGVRYDIKPSFFQLKDGSMPSSIKMEQYKNQLGFLAQQLEKVLPGSVLFDSVSNTYGVNYISLIPLLVEGIKEQQKQIETLQKVITLHETELIAIKKQLEALAATRQKSTAPAEEQLIAVEENTAGLFQNTPNPFTTDTRIEYYLPSSITKASIIIHDLQGGEIKQTELPVKGQGHIVINGSELKAGMYFYTLIADDRIIDTKRMILTE